MISTLRGGQEPSGRPHDGRPGPLLTFRFAAVPDLEKVVGLVESAYRGHESRAGWTTEADLLVGQRTDSDEVASLLHRDGSVVLLAESGIELVGCAHLERRGDGRAYFGMFAVRPDRQGGGIGGAVISQADRLAAAWGCLAVELTVIRQRPELIAWYQRQGFCLTGEARPFPYGDERYGRPQRDDLELLVLDRPTRQDGGRRPADRAPG